MPLRGNVLIRCCASPLSPSAVRAALMQLVSAESETIRPFQIAEMRSSLLTTRSWLVITWTNRSNTFGSIATSRSPLRSSRRPTSRAKSSKRYRNSRFPRAQEAKPTTSGSEEEPSPSQANATDKASHSQSRPRSELLFSHTTEALEEHVSKKGKSMSVDHATSDPSTWDPAFDAVTAAP